jgi:hypothetical protein
MMLNKSFTQQSDTRTILLFQTYVLEEQVVPTDVESPAMGYKDHSSNLDLCPRRMSVLPDVESHPMGYKDHSSNPDIRPRRMIVLDHFPSGHYCELRENVCPVPISPLWSLL